MEQLRMQQIVEYRAALYCRLSKDDEKNGDSHNQHADSVSIQTQKLLLEKYCLDHGFSVYDIYADDGYSGLNYERPGFNRMMADIESGKVNLVITKDLSRLGRDYIQTGYYIDVYFKRKRVRYIAVNDGIDTNKDENDIAPFKNIFNDFYSRDLSRKVKTAKRQRAYKGYYISAQTPYGYKVNPHNTNQLVVDEEPAKIVKEIFKLALTGKGTKKISSILTERRIITPSAYKAQNGDTRFYRYHKEGDDICKWCYQTIRAILTDRVYVGDMVNHKYEVVNYKTRERVAMPREQQIVVKNTHEAIISKEDYECAQTLLHQRHRPRRHEFDNVFKNLAFCSECGHHMTTMMKTLKTGLYGVLRCVNHFNHPEQCLHYHYIYYDDLYDEVLARIQKLANSLKSGELLESIQKKNIKKVKTDKLESEKSKINKRLQILKKIIKKLYEDMAEDRIDTDNYNNMLIEYTNEQKQLVQRMETIQETLESKDESEENINKLKEIIDEYLHFDTLTPNMLVRLVERIEIGHPEKKENGCKEQEINIIYRFIGTV